MPTLKENGCLELFVKTDPVDIVIEDSDGNEVVKLVFLEQELLATHLYQEYVDKYFNILPGIETFNGGFCHFHCENDEILGIYRSSSGNLITSEMMQSHRHFLENNTIKTANEMRAALCVLSTQFGNGFIDGDTAEALLDCRKEQLEFFQKNPEILPRLQKLVDFQKKAGQSYPRGYSSHRNCIPLLPDDRGLLLSLNDTMFINFYICNTFLSDDREVEILQSETLRIEFLEKIVRFFKLPETSMGKSSTEHKKLLDVACENNSFDDDQWAILTSFSYSSHATYRVLTDWINENQGITSERILEAFGRLTELRRDFHEFFNEFLARLLPQATVNEIVEYCVKLSTREDLTLELLLAIASNFREVKDYPTEWVIP